MDFKNKLVIYLFFVVIIITIVGPANGQNTKQTNIISEEAKIALEFVSNKENTSLENITVLGDNVFDAPLIEKHLQDVILVNKSNGVFYDLYVDKQNKTVFEKSDIKAEIKQKNYDKYGKIQPYLYEKIKNLKDEDVIRVAVLLNEGFESDISIREKKALDDLYNLYPQAREVIDNGGKPMDVEDSDLADRIYNDYVRIVSDGVYNKKAKLLEYLESQSLSPETTDLVKFIWISIKKKDIKKITSRDDIAVVLDAEREFGQPSLVSSVPSSRGPAVIRRGFNGTGATIAIVDDTNVDMDNTNPGVLCPFGTNNCFSQPGNTQIAIGNNTDPWHATLSASVAASNNSTYKGIAPGARVLSAGLKDGRADIDIADAAGWAINQGANVINTSYAYCWPYQGRDLQPIDYIYDDYARSNLKLFVVASGNDGSCFPNNVNVQSPGRGWNVLTVGAYDDRNTSQWSDDIMASFSGYINPTTYYGQTEKPEVVAPGASIEGIELNGQTGGARAGTSFAAPLVSGIGALLINRNSQLKFWPEAARAIIIATATNNIDKAYTGTPTGQDLQDGAGGVNADLADMTATTRGALPSTPSSRCSNSCWWGEALSPSSFDSSGYRYYHFYGKAGDTIRASSAWWSLTGCGVQTTASTASVPPNSTCGGLAPLYNDLSTQFFMGIKDPNGNFLNDAWAAGTNNAYQLVPPNNQITLPIDGIYQIAIYKNKFLETSNYLGVALTKLPKKTGTYDAQYANEIGKVVYQGTWYNFVNTPHASFQTIVYATTPGNRAIFNFNGTKISYIYSMASNRSSFTVYVDGTPYSMSAYAPEIRRQAMRNWEVPSGDHTIEVVSGNGVTDVDAFAVDVSPTTSGIYDDSSANIRYINSWSNYTASGAYNGYVKLANSSESAFRITFTGSAATYYHTKASNRGKASVTIDGINYGYVDLYSPSTLRQQFTRFPASGSLGPGTHSLHISYTGLKNASSTDTFIDVDRVDIHP